MLIVSQNKELIVSFGNTSATLIYHEKKKNGFTEHTICLNNPNTIIGKYATKERCIEILENICNIYVESCYPQGFYDYSANATRSDIIMDNRVFYFPKE